MTMHPLGWVLLVAGAGLSFFVLLMILGSSTPPSSALFPVLPLAVPCFLAAICWAAFTLEAGVARTVLWRIWDADSARTAPSHR
jgi:hypothetical protein